MSMEKAEEAFGKAVEKDKIKNDFCIKNDWEMIRISYLDFPNILSILHIKLMNII
jgi:hypothetical protein